MKDINKIIDSLSPVEQGVMHYKGDLIKVQSILLVQTDMAITLMLIMDHLELVDLKRKSMLN